MGRVVGPALGGAGGLQYPPGAAFSERERRPQPQSLAVQQDAEHQTTRQIRFDDERRA